MKYLFLLAFLITIVESCKKDSDKYFVNQLNIDKVLINEGSDSIGNLIYNISKVNDLYEVSIRFWDFGDSIKDNGFEFLVDTDTKNVLALTEGEVISSKNNWIELDKKSDYSLINFKGKGNRYIACKALSYPAEKGIYYYYWIQIYLSSRGDTLKIINEASGRDYIKTEQNK